MSKSPFSEQEMAFFEEGDTLSDESTAAASAAANDSDLNSPQERSNRWASRALAVLSLVGPTRSES